MQSTIITFVFLHLIRMQFALTFLYLPPPQNHLLTLEVWEEGRIQPIFKTFSLRKLLQALGKSSQVPNQKKALIVTAFQVHKTLHCSFPIWFLLQPHELDKGNSFLCLQWR